MSDWVFMPDIGQSGVATRVPTVKWEITLRYRSAIREKFDTKYHEYLRKKTVSNSDAYVIAINSCKIDSAIFEIEPPRIVKSVFPIGYSQVTFSLESDDISNSGFQYRPSIQRKSGTRINTGIFLDPSYSNLSGVIYSRANITSPGNYLGHDFIFVHNPMANNPVPKGLLKWRREYTTQEDEGGYTITYKSWGDGDFMIA